MTVDVQTTALAEAFASSGQSLSISFFVPCLNERGNIGRTVATIVAVMRKFGYPYEVILVDDASVDGTVHEVFQQSRQHPDARIRVIRNRFCRGLGRNYFIAAQRACYDYFMLVNGDGAEPPEMIEAIIERIGSADAVVPYFGRNDTRTRSRRILSLVFTTLVNAISGHGLRYYNGPVLHRTENVRMWFAETAGFGYQAELLCRLLDEGITVTEVRTTNSDRERGFSKAFTLSNLLSVANTLFHLALRRSERVAFRMLMRKPPAPPHDDVIDDRTL